MKGLVIFLSSCIAFSIQQDICLQFFGECIGSPPQCPTVTPSQYLNASDTNACLPNLANAGTFQCCEISAQYANCQDSPVCAGAITDPSKCSTGEQITCPLSCNSCNVALGINGTNGNNGTNGGPGTGNTTCVDTDPVNCPKAKAEGSCTLAFYQQNCPLSCGVCTANGSGSPSPAPVSGTCVDTDPVNCPKAAAMGSCTNVFYQQNCQKSCGMC